MPLYRTSDVRAFTVLSMLANVLIAAALVLIAIYHFYDPKLHYRDMSFVGMALSIILRYQLSMQKIEILEKRIANLMDAGLPGGKTGASIGNIALIFYLTFFWLALILIIIAFLPAGFQLTDYITLQ